MFSDGFKIRYTTIPFAVHKQRNDVVYNLYSHYHKEVELIVVVEGAIDFYIGSNCYEMKAGEVLIIPPYCVHRAHMYPGTYHECVCFDLSVLWDEALRRELEKGTLTVDSHLHARLPYTVPMYRCVRSAIAAHEQGYPGWEMDVIGNLSILFGRLKHTDFFVKSGSADPDSLFVKSVLAYISEHYSEPVTSRTAAELLHLNPSYFCRLFKKNFGCSFTEYMIKYRIENAKLRLNNGDESISDIALKTGFNGFSYFSEMFKKLVGVSPSEYRKSNNDDNAT